MNYGMDHVIKWHFMDEEAFIMRHFSVLMMIVEMWLNRLSFAGSHAVFQIMYFNAYAIFCWLVLPMAFFPRYFPIDWNHAVTFAWLFGLLVFMLAIYRLVMALDSLLKLGVTD